MQSPLLDYSFLTEVVWAVDPRQGTSSGDTASVQERDQAQDTRVFAGCVEWHFALVISVVLKFTIGSPWSVSETEILHS